MKLSYCQNSNNSLGSCQDLEGYAMRVGAKGKIPGQASCLGMKAIRLFCAFCDASPQGPWRFRRLLGRPAKILFVSLEDRDQQISDALFPANRLRLIGPH